MEIFHEIAHFTFTFIKQIVTFLLLNEMESSLTEQVFGKLCFSVTCKFGGSTYRAKTPGDFAKKSLFQHRARSLALFRQQNSDLLSGADTYYPLSHKHATCVEFFRAVWSGTGHIELTLGLLLIRIKTHL